MSKILPKHFTCIGCGLTDKRVEAGGIYYCPNPACTATGAWSHRTNLKSYREEGDHHFVDPNEMIRYVNEEYDLLEEEIAIRAEVCLSLYWGKVAS